MREKQIVQDVRRAVRGAGGGGKGGGGDSQRAPVEAPDSLRSIEYARVLDLLSEGETSGLYTGDGQSIYLNDTPLQNADGTYNFSGVSYGTVNGTQAQSYLPGFSAVESETAVGTQVTASSSVTRQVSNANVNAVRVTVGIPRLTSQDTTSGDLNGTSVTIAIDVQSNGGGYVAQTLPDGGLISGKTTTRYQRSYRLDLSGLTAPWDIRVRRVTADSSSSSVSNQTWWDSYTEIIDAKFSYPNSALVGLQLDASQFNAIPRRAYDIKGIKVQIPSNYNPLTRVYTGVWAGNFTTAWTDNPAWCFYDLLTNTRYGLGNYVAAAQIDKWSLYSIAQYCDELVPNGFGGTEPRYTCNLYLQTRAEAFKVLANMASIFRGMTYWGAGAIVPVADKPSDAIALFTMANVIDGKFTYAGSAKNTRHTVALVTWNDPANNYQQAVEYVEDSTGIARYGVVDTQIVAFGCTSRGQAHRLGKWLLYSERLLTETVTFRTGLDGVLVYPGAVIDTQDAARAGKRFGGRVVSATVNAVTIDSPVTIVGGTTYTLLAIAPDGTVVSSSVTNGAGSTSVISVSPALSQAPQVNAVWVLAASDLAPETWRVLAATEVDKSTLEIVTLKHDATKYAAVEQNLLFEPAQTTTIKTQPDAVTSLTATEMLFEISSGVVSDRVTLSWTGTTGRYRVSYRGLLSNWVVLPEQAAQTVDIDGLNADSYTFNVVQVSALGIASPTNALMQEIYGKTAAPADITGLTVQKVAGKARVQWTAVADLDVAIGGEIVIRHSMFTGGAVWNNSVILDQAPGGVTVWDTDLVSGTYLVKARDSSGNYSANAVSFVATEGMVSGFNTVASTDQAALGFTGAKSNVANTGSSIQLDSVTLIDSMLSLIDSWPAIDALGGVSSSGTYDFDTYMDHGTVATRRYESDIQASQFDTADLIDSRLANIDDWNDVDGSVVNDCDVTLFASTTNDDPAGAPTWGSYVPYRVADFTCRAIKHRLSFASGNPQHNISVSTLKVDAKTPVSP